ncbi:MAG: hypothetical protein N3E42_03595 [Candidatus Bipolaricaulota bacterium]|nr:hypothetical protein [Candidatus Bipolaricaulota bacterium]
MRFLSERDVRLLAEQPECLLPPLSPERTASLRSLKNLALVEIAGRDSIAAAITALQERPLDALLPTLAYHGAQYGSLESVEFALDLLARKVGRARVCDLAIIGSPKFWQALTVRFADLLTERFGFYTPYVACHLYIHAIRVPLAKYLNCRVIISGERESHNGAIKLNQTPAVLDRYAQLTAHFGVELWQPLRKVQSGAEIEKILGEPWPAGQRQLHCMLSGNYKNPDGSVDFGPGRRFSDEKSAQFLDEYALPLAKICLEKIVRGKPIDYEAEASKLLRTGSV